MTHPNILAQLAKGSASLKGKALYPWDLAGVSERLRHWWAWNYPTSEIAKRLSLEFPGIFNKNMVIGRARRMGLPPRPNPTKKQIPDALHHLHG